MRANLLASAPATSFGDLRSKRPASHGVGLCRPALMCLSSAVAPTTKTDRSAESPALVMPPWRIRPPVEWSFGVDPSQVAKSRPDRKLCAGGAFMLSIVDPMGPMPETVAIRRLASSCRCQFNSLLLISSRRASTVAYSFT